MKKGFKIYLFNNKKERILLTDYTSNNSSITYNENFTEEENDKYTLTFDIAKNGNHSFDHEIDATNLVRIGRVLELVVFSPSERKMKLVISSISPVGTAENIVWSITAVDYASFIFSKNNVELTLDTFEDEEYVEWLDFNGLDGTARDILNYILIRGSLRTEGDVGDNENWRVEKSNNPENPLNQKINISLSSSNTYNAMVEVALLTNSFLSIDYQTELGPKISLISRDDLDFKKNYFLDPHFNLQNFSLEYSGDTFYPILYVTGGEDELGIVTSMIPYISYSQYQRLHEYFDSTENGNIDVRNYFDLANGFNYYSNVAWEKDEKPSEDELKIMNYLPYLDSFIINLDYFQKNNLISYETKIEILDLIYNDLRKINLELGYYVGRKYRIEGEINRIENAINNTLEEVVLSEENNYISIEEKLNRLFLQEGGGRTEKIQKDSETVITGSNIFYSGQGLTVTYADISSNGFIFYEIDESTYIIFEEMVNISEQKIFTIWSPSTLPLTNDRTIFSFSGKFFASGEFKNIYPLELDIKTANINTYNTLSFENNSDRKILDEGIPALNNPNERRYQYSVETNMSNKSDLNSMVNIFNDELNYSYIELPTAEATRFVNSSSSMTDSGTQIINYSIVGLPGEVVGNFYSRKFYKCYGTDPNSVSMQWRFIGEFSTTIPSSFENNKIYVFKTEGISYYYKGLNSNLILIDFPSVTRKKYIKNWSESDNVNIPVLLYGEGADDNVTEALVLSSDYKKAILREFDQGEVTGDKFFEDGTLEIPVFGNISQGKGISGDFGRKILDWIVLQDGFILTLETGNILVKRNPVNFSKVTQWQSTVEITALLREYSENIIEVYRQQYYSQIELKNNNTITTIFSHAIYPNFQNKNLAIYTDGGGYWFASGLFFVYNNQVMRFGTNNQNYTNFSETVYILPPQGFPIIQKIFNIGLEQIIWFKENTNKGSKSLIMNYTVGGANSVILGPELDIEDVISWNYNIFIAKVQNNNGQVICFEKNENNIFVNRWGSDLIPNTVAISSISANYGVGLILQAQRTSGGTVTHKINISFQLSASLWNKKVNWTSPILGNNLPFRESLLTGTGVDERVYIFRDYSLLLMSRPPMVYNFISIANTLSASLLNGIALEKRDFSSEGTLAAKYWRINWDLSNNFEFLPVNSGFEASFVASKINYGKSAFSTSFEVMPYFDLLNIYRGKDFIYFKKYEFLREIMSVMTEKQKLKKELQKLINSADFAVEEEAILEAEIAELSLLIGDVDELIKKNYIISGCPHLFNNKNEIKKWETAGDTKLFNRSKMFYVSSEAGPSSFYQNIVFTEQNTNDVLFEMRFKTPIFSSTVKVFFDDVEKIQMQNVPSNIWTSISGKFSLNALPTSEIRIEQEKGLEKVEMVVEFIELIDLTILKNKSFISDTSVLAYRNWEKLGLLFETDSTEDVYPTYPGIYTLRYEKYDYYMKKYFKNAVEIPITDTIHFLTKFWKDKKDSFWFNLKSKYGEYLYEGFYENDIESNSINLYRQGLENSKYYDSPEESYNMTYLDGSSILSEDTDLELIRVGDYISISKDGLGILDEEKNEIQVSAINRSLRDLSNIQLTVNTVKRDASLIEKIIASISKN